MNTLTLNHQDTMAERRPSDGYADMSRLERDERVVPCDIDVLDARTCRGAVDIKALCHWARDCRMTRIGGAGVRATADCRIRCRASNTWPCAARRRPHRCRCRHRVIGLDLRHIRYQRFAERMRSLSVERRRHP